MTRAFAIANFLGVVAVAILCAIQWRDNSRLDARARQLDQIRLDQSAKLEAQAQSLKDDAADMQDLRQRLMMSESQATSLLQQRDRLALEKKQLIAALDKWVAGVKQRDAALKQAADRIAALTAARDDAINKLNDLTNKYNNVVKELREAQESK